MMEIISEENLSPTEVYNRLKDEEELKGRQQNTLEYLEKYARVKDSQTYEELVEELEELDGFKEEHINKIIEVLPATETEVRSLFSKERVKLEDSDIQKIVEFSRSVSN